MSLRIDTGELISGAYVVGDTGLGVLAENIPSSGLDGASFLYNDLSLPADNGKEIRGLIVTPPSAGTFFAWEDGSFSLIGAPDGEYSFTYRLYVDGVDQGTAEAGITIGVAATSELSGSAALGGITAGGGLVGATDVDGGIPLSLGGRRRKRDWRSFDVMPHWTPPDADGDMSDGEPVSPEEDAEPVKVRSALSMGLDGSGDAPAPVEPAAAVVEVVLEPESKPLTLADVITRDDLTHDELVQAIKLLARAQSGGLVRSTPRLTLRRVS